MLTIKELFLNTVGNGYVTSCVTRSLQKFLVAYLRILSQCVSRQKEVKYYTSAAVNDNEISSGLLRR